MPDTSTVPPSTWYLPTDEKSTVMFTSCADSVGGSVGRSDDCAGLDEYEGLLVDDVREYVEVLREYVGVLREYVEVLLEDVRELVRDMVDIYEMVEDV